MILDVGIREEPKAGARDAVGGARRDDAAERGGASIGAEREFGRGGGGMLGDVAGLVTGSGSLFGADGRNRGGGIILLDVEDVITEPELLVGTGRGDALLEGCG